MASAPDHLPAEPPDLTRRLVRVANVVLRYRWIFILLPLLAGGLTVMRTMRQPRTYTATATFMTQAGARPQPGGLAAQLGINLSNNDATLSPDFYGDLLRSRPVILATAHTPVTIPVGDTVRTQTLVEYYGGEDRAVDRIGAGISTAVRARTGVVVLSFRAESPQLAQQIASALLAQLDEFNRRRRKSRVGAERQFTEARFSEAAAELKSAEDALQDFYTRNRDFTRSPELRFREDRLAREVARRQTVYASLAQALEQAKIDEVRETPVITVLEDPILPRIADPRHTRDRALLAVAFGLLAASVLAGILNAARGTRRADQDDLAELRQLVRNFLGELRNPVRAARRVFSGVRSAAA